MAGCAVRESSGNAPEAMRSLGDRCKRIVRAGPSGPRERECDMTQEEFNDLQAAIDAVALQDVALSRVLTLIFMYLVRAGNAQ